MENHEENEINLIEVKKEKGICFYCKEEKTVIKIDRYPSENWEFDMQLCEKCLRQIITGKFLARI